MNKSQHMLTKTCSNCGLQKPLSAFLQMSGVRGAAYGNICSTCRKTAMDKLKNPKEKETSSTSGASLGIGHEEKVQEALVKNQRHQEVEERYHEDRDKQEDKQVKQLEKTQTIAKDEKKHRESFLKQRSFLSTHAKQADANKLADRQTKEARQQVENATTRDALQDSTTKQEQAVKEDLEAKNIDLSSRYIPSQTGFQLKYGVAFQALKTRLGSSAFLNRLEQASQKLDPEGNLTNENEADVVNTLSKKR